jgi:hypothetical protein
MSGFQYRGTESQGDVTGKIKAFHVDSAHSGVLGVGDLVVLTGTADTDGTPEVDTGVTTTANTGVIVGVKPNYAGEALSQTHLSASTAGTVYVNVDPDALYEVDVATTTLVANDVGLNCRAVVTAGTVNGSVFVSNMKADGANTGTTATLPLRIVELREDSAGTLGDAAIVKLNATTSRAGATGI